MSGFKTGVLKRHGVAGIVAASGSTGAIHGVVIADDSDPGTGDVLTSTDGESAVWATNPAWKQPVRVATTATGTISTAYEAGDTVDGVVLAEGDRILLKDQSTGSQNGIYVVEASGSPSRAFDMDEDEEMIGALVRVIAGTANAAKVFGVTNTTEPVLETDDINWAEFGAGGSGSVATDTIWDTKGDLAAATGSNAAAVLPAAATNGAVLVTASGETTGLDWLINKYDATAAPTVNDDSGDGYAVGSVWIDITGDAAYICVDATGGAAVWVPFDSGAPGGSTGPPYDMFGTVQLFPEAINSWGSAAWDVANRALYIPFILPDDMTCNKLFYVTGGTTTGGGSTLDIGIYDASGTRLVSTGSTAYNQNNNNTHTVIDVADTALTGNTLYYLAFVGSSTSASILFTRWDTGANGSSFLGCYMETSALPLPATATFAQTTTSRIIPMIGIAARSEVA